LAEAGDRAIDEPLIPRGKAAIVEAVSGEAADLENLDQHIGVTDQRLDPFAVNGVTEISDNAGLAAIGSMKIGGVAIAIGIIDERSPIGAFHRLPEPPP